MSVIYRPLTISEYYATTERLRQVNDEYELLRGDAATAFHEEHWDDLKAVVEPPPLNSVMVHELLMAIKLLKE